MNKIKNEPLSEDLDFPDFDDYDIISGNDFVSNEAKTPMHSDGAVNFHQDDLFNAIKTSVNLYNDEWEKLFNKHIDIGDLKKKSLNGELRSNRFRSICWRCMLGILHNEPNQWLFELKTYRSHYSDLWIELKQNPWNVERKNPADNPLSQEAESIWQKYFSNEELKSMIHQDVVRTFPGVEFFRKESVQQLMVRILFCYARQNPLLCYRQGMHEILAPLIFVLHCDHQALLYAREQNLADSVIFEILDPKYIEEDSYILFKHVMNNIECSYRINNLMPTSAGYFPTQTSDDKNYENEVINRLQYIKENILRSSDPDLNKHLDELDIPLHLFGIRWLRLLFGREFRFYDLLVLWDAIFAINNFELVNYIVVAMLTAIRSILLMSDYTTCLTNLMHYPSGVDIKFVIEYALHLMDPSNYSAPAFTSVSNKPSTLIPKAKFNSKLSRSSENCDILSTSMERLKLVPARPKKWLSGKSHSLILTGSGDGKGNIVEGFRLDDLKIVKSDTESLSAVIELVKTKLFQHYKTLSANLAGSQNEEIRSALDGIHELCTILTKYGSHPPEIEIEPAIEAGEIKQTLSPEKKRNYSRKQMKYLSDTDTVKAHTLPKRVKKLPAGELKVFKQCQQGGPIVGAPMADPLRFMRKLSGENYHDSHESADNDAAKET